MDKFEFRLKAKQLTKLVAAKDYTTALEVVETMEWNRSKDVSFLISAAEVYEANGRYDEAIDVLLRAYEFSGNGRLITYKLTNLAIQAGNKEEAVAYLEEFVNVAPKDMERYALEYQVAKLNGEPAEKLIGILEKQREVDLDEEWSYELAELYHQVGREEECVELCDEIMLYYALGQYVEKAGALKKQYRPLTPEQEELFENPEKFEENLRRTQEEFQDKAMIETVNEHMAEETPEEEASAEDTLSEEAPQEEVAAVNLSEGEEAIPAEEPEVQEDFDFAALVQPLDVLEEAEDDLYFTEDGEEEPEEEESEEEVAPEDEIVPIFEDEPVLYVEDPEEEEWMEEDEETAEEPEETEDEPEVPVPEEELPEIIPPFAVGVEAEPEEVTLAWKAVPEAEVEEEIRRIFSQEVTVFYEDSEEIPEEYYEEAEEADEWPDEEEQLLEEAEQAVMAALEEDEEELLEEPEEDPEEELTEEPEEEEIPAEEEEFPLNLAAELEAMLDEPVEAQVVAGMAETMEPEETLEEAVEPVEEPEEDEDFFEDPEDDEEEDEDFFEDPEDDEEEDEPAKDVMPKKTHHILVRTDYADRGMKMAVEALKRLPDEIRPKAIAKTSGEKLNRKGIRGSYEQLQNKILIITEAGALEKAILADIREFIVNPDNHCIAVLIDTSEKIGEMCVKDPALAALFTTDYEYYEYSPDELVAHGVDYAAEKGYTFDEMAMLALYAGVEDIISEADGTQWIQTEELVEHAIRKAEKKGLFSRGPKVGKDGKKILKEDHLF